MMYSPVFLLLISAKIQVVTDNFAFDREVMINDQWAAVAVFSFWAWVFSCIGFILQSFPRQHLFIPKTAAIWGGVSVLSFCAWLVGMLNA